ncbi:MAG: integrase arm-type DNA-binding domain-containing protein, partial [Nitrospinales bacterium]
MPPFKLTDLSLRALTPPSKGQRLYRDKTIPGFGVRVSQGGTKSFVVVTGANRQLITIGRYPILSLSVARTEAKRLLAEKTLGKMRRVSLNFEEARDLFLEACEAKNKPRTIYDYKRVLNRHFNYGKMRLDDITQHELMRRIFKLS